MTEVAMHWSQQGSERGNRAGMYTVHATKKLPDRMKEPVEEPVLESTTRLGNWYTKTLFWRLQYALFVNEKTSARPGSAGALGNASSTCSWRSGDAEQIRGLHAASSS